MDTVMIQPKKIIRSAKFGISINPNKTYVATLENDRYHVQVDDIVSLIVAKNHVNVIDPETEIFQDTYANAMGAICKRVQGFIDSTPFDSADDISSAQGELDDAMRAVTRVEESKNVEGIRKALIPYVGEMIAKKVTAVKLGKKKD